MKSRVINTKHLVKMPGGNYLGLTSRLKPSLFYGYPVREGTVYLQFMERGCQMAHYTLDESLTSETDDGKTMWFYEPDEKAVKKFPDLEGTHFIVLFDQINTRKWKNQKNKEKWLYGKKPSAKHIAFKKKTHAKRMKRKARMLAKQQKERGADNHVE